MLRRFSREDGQSLLVVLVAIPLFFVVSAFVVDVANAYVHRQSAQNDADNIAIALAQDVPCTPSDCTTSAAFAADNAKYTSTNGVSAPLTYSATCATDPNVTNCYVTPYGSGQAAPHQIFVKVTLNSPTYFAWSEKFFGGAGPNPIKTTATAVGAFTGGPPPQITFASLNSSCQHHTLVIRSSGHLTVNNKIYVNSCSGLSPDNTHDGFDIFGTGGSITDPVDILVHGGWETHAGLSVIINGKTCPLLNANSNSYSDAYATANGCPKVGQPLLPDPFNGISPPALDPSGVPNNNCSVANPCYTATEFSVPLFLDSNITAGATSLVADPATGMGGETWPALDFYVGLEGERIKVHARGGAPAGAPAGAQTLSSLTRGVLGTVAAAHNEPVLSVTGVRSVANVPCPNTTTTSSCVTITTSTPHNLSVGDWVRVNLTSPNNNYDGVFQVADIPDDETAANPVEFEYVIPGAAKADLGAGTITAAARAGGVSTITLAAAPSPAISVGDPVVVDITSGDTSFDEALDDGATVTGVSNGGKTFTYNQPLLPDVTGGPVTIKSVARFEGTATIVTNANHTLTTGDSATISNPDDPSFSGHKQVAVTNNTTFTYSNSGSDVPPDKLANAVTKWQRTAGVTTLTAGTAGIVVGTYIIVHLNGAANTSFNGKYKVTAVTGGANSTLSYAQPGLPDVALTNAPAGTENTLDGLVPIASYSRSGGVATVTTSAAHGLATNNDVIVDVANSSFNGTFNITKVSNTVFTYPNPGPDVASTLGVAGDGVTGNLSAGKAVSESNPNDIVTPDADSTVAGIFGSAGAAGAASGPLLELFNVNPTAITSPSGPLTPSEFQVPAGTNYTFSPGTYYGGICIGAPIGANCGTKVGGACNTSVAAPSTVILQPGIYIMAGGGFFVCGNATLDASQGVMIYNTQDSASAVGGVIPNAGKLDQVRFNTNGNVTLSPLVGTEWNGFSIYQGPDPADPSSSPQPLQMTTANCDNRPFDTTDILLQNAGNGLNGFSGTVYAPAQDALFNDSVSGTADLAVISGCIFIDGATSTFTFNPQDHGGSGWGLVG
jgi:Flp pilus assembly protein TadG